MKNRKSTASRSPDTSPEPAGKGRPTLSGEIRGKIGRQLREMYDDMVSQGVPDRFVELLNRLEKQNGNEK